jgi:hypothetical protein
MRGFVWLLIVILILAHQDFWFWDDPRLVFGFVPIGLFYHMVLSVLAGGLWYLATLFCWPTKLVDQETPNSAAKTHPSQTDREV